MGAAKSNESAAVSVHPLHALGFEERCSISSPFSAHISAVDSYLFCFRFALWLAFSWLVSAREPGARTCDDGQHLRFFDRRAASDGETNTATRG